MKVVLNENCDYVLEFDYEEKRILCKAARNLDMDIESVIYKSFEENLRTMRLYVKTIPDESCRGSTPWCDSKSDAGCVGCSCVISNGGG